MNPVNYELISIKSQVDANETWGVKDVVGGYSPNNLTNLQILVFGYDAGLFDIGTFNHSVASLIINMQDTVVNKSPLWIAMHKEFIRSLTYFPGSPVTVNPNSISSDAWDNSYYDGIQDNGLIPLMAYIRPINTNYVTLSDNFNIGGMQPSSVVDGIRSWENGQMTYDSDGNEVEIILTEGIVKIEMRNTRDYGLYDHMPYCQNCYDENNVNVVEENSTLPASSSNQVIVYAYLNPIYPIGDGFLTPNVNIVLDIDGDAVPQGFSPGTSPMFQYKFRVEMEEGANSNCNIETYVNPSLPSVYSSPWFVPEVQENINPWVGEVLIKRSMVTDNSPVPFLWTSLVPDYSLDSYYGSSAYGVDGTDEFVSVNDGNDGTLNGLRYKMEANDDSAVFWFRIVPKPGYSVCMYNFNVKTHTQNPDLPPNVRYNNEIKFHGHTVSNEYVPHPCESTFAQIISNYSVESLYESDGGTAFSGSTCQFDTYWPWFNVTANSIQTFGGSLYWRFGAKCFKNVLLQNMVACDNDAADPYIYEASYQSGYAWENDETFNCGTGYPFGSSLAGAIGDHPFGDVFLIDKNRVLSVSGGTKDMYQQFTGGIEDGNLTASDFEGNEVIIGIAGLNHQHIIGNFSPCAYWGILCNMDMVWYRDYKLSIEGKAMEIGVDLESVQFEFDIEIN